MLEVVGPLRIPLVWLRDHCRNAANFNEKTKQRKGDCTKLFSGAELADDWFGKICQTLLEIIPNFELKLSNQF